MWVLSLTLFLAGSVLSGVAWDVGSLIVFRVVQGIGAGLMLPIMQTLLLRAAGGRGIGRLMSIITLPALIGPILGPVVGGLIVGHFSWRWVFYVNVPICVIAILLAWWLLPTDSPRTNHRLDTIGLLLLSPAVAALMYGVSQINVLSLVVGLLLLAGFVYRALKTAEPLIDLRLFTKRSFAASSALMFLSGLALFGPMLVLSLYYQQVRGLGVIVAGLMLAPQGLGSLLARGAGGLADRIGPRPVILGSIVLIALGTVPFAFADQQTNVWLLGAALVVRGFGLSSVNMAVMVGAFDGLNRTQIPHASSATRIMQQVGGSFGTAVLAVILQGLLASHPVSVAFDQTFLWTLAFTALALVPALLLPRRSHVQQRPEMPRRRGAVAEHGVVPRT
jgi:EmrB/QacA subfamily drug resistance transporter